MALPRKVPLTDTPRHLTHPEEYTLTTRELAELVGVESDSPSKRYKLDGHWFGYLPRKVSSWGGYSWPVWMPGELIRRFSVDTARGRGKPPSDSALRDSITRAGAIL